MTIFLKLENKIILDYYIKEVRPLTEQGVPIWNSSLTKKQINAIEKIQKVALKIILGQQYESYYSACQIFGLQKLSTRRLELSTKFAIKAIDAKNFLHLSTKMWIPEVMDHSYWNRKLIPGDVILLHTNT